MEFVRVVQRQAQLMDNGQSQHSIGLSSITPLFFCSVEEGLSDVGALGLQEVDEDVNSS